MVKPEPIWYWCKECKWIHPDGKKRHHKSPDKWTTYGYRDYIPCGSKLEPMYTSSTIRKAFNDLADHLANNDTNCFCDVEVRKRSRQW